MGAAPPPGYQPMQIYPAYAGQQYDQQRPYASFGARLGAFIIDALVSLVFELPAIIAFAAGPRERRACTVNGERGTCNLPTGATVALGVLLAVIGGIAFLVIFCRKISRSQSWGMKATGITVVGADSGQRISAARAFGWYLAHVFSGFFCYLGYLWMLWDKRNQTWHDKIAGTVLVKV
jgi:uncharacterized RDD family membrane protein YckC